MVARKWLLTTLKKTVRGIQHLMRSGGESMAEYFRRGDIVRVRLDPTEGSEQGGVRPAVVLSPDLINASSPVILVAPLTTKKTDRLFRLKDC